MEKVRMEIFVLCLCNCPGEPVRCLIAASCQWCCRDNTTSPCEPFDDGSGILNLPKGMPCTTGYCDENVGQHWSLL